MAFLCCDPVQIRISVNAEIFHNLRHRVIAVFYFSHNVSLDYLFGRTKINASLHALESSLITEEGNIPIDFIFELNREDKELIRRLLLSLSEKPQHSTKSKNSK